jgi:hypothetical protein
MTWKKKSARFRRFWASANYRSNLVKLTAGFCRSFMIETKIIIEEWQEALIEFKQNFNLGRGICYGGKQRTTI